MKQIWIYWTCTFMVFIDKKKVYHLSPVLPDFIVHHRHMEWQFYCVRRFYQHLLCMELWCHWSVGWQCRSLWFNHTFGSGNRQSSRSREKIIKAGMLLFGLDYSGLAHTDSCLKHNSFFCLNETVVFYDACRCVFISVIFIHIFISVLYCITSIIFNINIKKANFVTGPW